MVVGQQKGLQVVVELGRSLVVVSLHGGFSQHVVEALDSPVGPGMTRLGEAVLNALLVAHAVEDVPPGMPLMRNISEIDIVVG